MQDLPCLRCNLALIWSKLAFRNRVVSGDFSLSYIVCSVDVMSSCRCWSCARIVCVIVNVLRVLQCLYTSVPAFGRHWWIWWSRSAWAEWSQQTECPLLSTFTLMQVWIPLLWFLFCCVCFLGVFLLLLLSLLTDHVSLYSSKCG